jgi:uncharacterized protein GlcG (DUF336 family)
MRTYPRLGLDHARETESAPRARARETGVHVGHAGRFTAFVGALPILVGDELVAGIGRSLRHPDQDALVGRARLDALLASRPG